jgi:hypothetical protein
MSNQGILECICGRTFSQENAYGKHRRSCKLTKKRLSGALDKAKEVFAQKRRKVSQAALTSTSTVPLAQSLPEAVPLAQSLPEFLVRSDIS